MSSDSSSKSDGKPRHDPVEERRPLDLLTLLFIIFPWAGFILTCFTLAWISVNMFHHSALVSTLCFLVVPLTIKVGFAVSKHSYESDEVGCGCGFIAIAFFFIFFPVAEKIVQKQHIRHHSQKSVTPAMRTH